MAFIWVLFMRHSWRVCRDMKMADLTSIINKKILCLNYRRSALGLTALFDQMPL